MDRLVLAGLVNGALASLLALVVVAATRAWRNPYFGRIAWLAVILKLVTPPLLFIPVEVAWLESTSAPVPATAITLSDQPARIAAELPLVAAGVEGQAAVGLPPTEVAPRAVEVADERGAVAKSLQGLVRTLRSLDLLRTLGGAWLAGSLLLGVLGATRIWRFQRSLSRSQLASPAVAGRAAAIAGRLDLCTLPRIAVVAGRVAPLAWSLGRQATVIVPAALVETLEEDSLDAVLAHELTHLRRRDHWARWLELVAITLYWWCPTTWFARRRVHEAEEQCCDADVLRMFPALRRGYGRALLETLDLLAGDRSLAPGASGWGTRRSLRRRFEQIAAERRVAPLRSWGRGSCWAAIALLCLLAPTGASSEEPKLEPASAPTLSALPEDASHDAPTVTLHHPSLPQERLDALKTWDLTLTNAIRLTLENHPDFLVQQSRDADSQITVTMVPEKRRAPMAFLETEELVLEVAEKYWELYFAYQELAIHRDEEAAALETWRRVKAQLAGGSEADENRSRRHYFACRQQVETSQTRLSTLEHQLRWAMRLSSGDGRLMHPTTTPKSGDQKTSLPAAMEQAAAKRAAAHQRFLRLENEQQEADRAAANHRWGRTISEITTGNLARQRYLMEMRDAAAGNVGERAVTEQLGRAVSSFNLTSTTTQLSQRENVVAQKEAAVAEEEYQAGDATLYWLLKTRQECSAAAVAHQRSLADYQHAALQLERLQGTLLESLKIRIAE